MKPSITRDPRFVSRFHSKGGKRETNAHTGNETETKWKRSGFFGNEMETKAKSAIKGGNENVTLRFHLAYFTLAAPARAGYSLPMSVATLQQFGQSLPSWLALVQRGETVAIVDGGREVARLVPPEAAHTKHTAASVQWPDFAARRRAVFGDVVLPAGTAAALVNEDRGA